MSDFLALIRQVLPGRPPRLRFEDERESRFLKAESATRLRHATGSGLFALVAYNLFLLSDRSMVPDMFETALTVRLFIFTPFALLLALACVLLKDWILSLPSWLFEGTLMMTGVLAALTMGVMMVGTESPFGIVYRGGMVAILIYGNLVQRFRFQYALVFSVCAVGICVFSTALTFGKPHPHAVLELPLLVLVTVVAVYTLIMNFRMELQERLRFLHAERAAIMRAEIEASRTALEDLARQDPLTGLANRRYFDEITPLWWEKSLLSGGSMALLLIDVDHFKAYNDRYGHPVGDECLRHVAQVLQRVVPTSMGTVVRWGGEEFVVLLPQMEASQAMQLAQTLNTQIAAQALRHEASSTAKIVTISIGVACANLKARWSSVDELIAMADVALYRAKHEGRNRWVLAGPPQDAT